MEFNQYSARLEVAVKKQVYTYVLFSLLITYLFLGCAAKSQFTQNSREVQVTITDETNKLPLQKAQVKWDGRKVGVTDDNGKLKITTNPGAHKLLIAAAGYEKFDTEYIEVSKEDDLQIKLGLRTKVPHYSEISRLIKDKGKMGKIIGRIVDKLTRKAMPGVLVKVNSFEVTHTNNQGEFFILEVYQGEYRVTAFMDGYNTKTLYKVLVHDDLTTSLKFFLEPQ